MLARFGLLALVPVVALGAVLAYELNAGVKQQHLDSARTNAVLLAQVGIQPLLDAGMLNSGFTAPQISELDQRLQGAALSKEVRRLKIWNRTGTVLYSDNHALIGRNFEIEDDLAEALEGHASAGISDDVIVENLRPGAMAKLGLDYETLRAINPRLVYVAASGWGQDGPLADLPGLDIMAQARSGLMSITGEHDGDPVKVGVPICDLVCALYGALAAVAALATRSRTGEGQLIDVSLFESAMSLAVWEAGKFFASGEVPGRLGSAHQSSAPYQAVRAEDGWFTVGAATQATWRGLCEALDLTPLENDPLYADPNSRFRNREALIAELSQVTATMPAGHWIRRLEEHGVPCSPIQDYSQSFNDPHLLARDYFWDAPHRTIESVRQLGSPMRFSRTPVRQRRAGPQLGEDTRPILRELGCSDTAIDELLADKVVGEPQGLVRT